MNEMDANTHTISDTDTTQVKPKKVKFTESLVFTKPLVIKLIVILFTCIMLVIFTLYLMYPIITWCIIGGVIGAFYSITRPYIPITDSYKEYKRTVDGATYWDEEFNSKTHSIYDYRTITPEIHKQRYNGIIVLGRALFGLVCFGVCFIISFITYNNNVFSDYMFKKYKNVYANTSSENVTDVNRISCTQNVITYKTVVTVDSGYVDEFYSLFTTIKDQITITNKYVKGTNVYKVDTVVDTLRIDGITCGDTIHTVNRKAYNDRNFSLIKTRNQYIGLNWKVVDTTYYTNQSNEIPDWAMRDIFDNTRAEFTYDKYTTKYSVKLLDANKTDTIDSKEDAQGLLNAKCKDKATTIAGKLIYTEYDACKNSNTISIIKIKTRNVCGYSQVTLEYDRGAVSATPDNCWGKSNTSWTYE